MPREKTPTGAAARGGEDENVLEMNGGITQNLFEKGSHLRVTDSPEQSEYLS